MSWYSSSSTTRNLLALERTDLGLSVGQPGAELDLVGEVHQPEVALEPPVGLDQAEQLLAPAEGVEHLRDRARLVLRVLRPRLLEARDACAVLERAHVVGLTRCSLIAASSASR